MIIIGITGTLGAGKGTIVEYLVEKHNFKHYSARDFIIEEIKKRGLDVNRDSMTIVANDLRAKNSPSYIIEELYAKANEKESNAIIESIRTPGEIEFLHKQGNFILLAINANPKIRYERIFERKSNTDKISFGEFLANEEREFKTTDPNKQNLSACINQANYTLKNNGSLEDLHSQIDKVYSKIENK